MSRPAIDIAKLTPDERLQLIEELWESLSPEQRDAIPLTTEQEAELDRRLDALEQEGPVGVSSDELFARIQTQVSPFSDPARREHRHADAAKFTT